MAGKIVDKGSPLHTVLEQVILEAAEEQQVLVSAQGGDQESISKVYAQFRPLVHYISDVYARRITGFAPDEDLRQEGAIGLLAAIRRFDSSLGRFHVYAASMIKGYVKTATVKEINHRVNNPQVGEYHQIPDAESMGLEIREDLILEESLSALGASLKLEDIVSKREAEYLKTKYNLQD